MSREQDAQSCFPTHGCAPKKIAGNNSDASLPPPYAHYPSKQLFPCHLGAAAAARANANPGSGAIPTPPVISLLSLTKTNVYAVHPFINGNEHKGLSSSFFQIGRKR